MATTDPLLEILAVYPNVTVTRAEGHRPTGGVLACR